MGIDHGKAVMNLGDTMRIHCGFRFFQKGQTLYICG